MKIFSSLLVAFVLATGCKNQSHIPGDCIKGMYLGRYCGGAVIQIMDKRIEGKKWKSDDRTYENCLVVNFDSTVFNSAYYPEPSYSEPGSIFYFKFKEGGYPRRTFDYCEPSPFITITFTSPTPCF